MPCGRTSEPVRVRQPLYGLNGAWHCTLVLALGNLDALALGAVLGYLIGRDIARVFWGTYVAVK